MGNQNSYTQKRWVFGYGSLMWRPGFSHSDVLAGRLFGYRRSLCVYSHVHRGTPQTPGLVLGLNTGGSCRGTLYGVEEQDWNEVISYLRAREQPTKVYIERILPVHLAEPLPTGERSLPATCYVVDRAHEQFAGDLDVDVMADYVRQGRGQSGDNIDYVANTLAHIKEVGLSDPLLEAVVRKVRED